MDLIRSVENDQLKKSVVAFRPGDTIRVQIKVIEGGKERLQASRASASSARTAA